jgi:hypothetical protein
MKNWIQKLFRTPPPDSTLASSALRHEAASPGENNPATIQEGSENAIRRQLVQVLLRDVIRRHGIPPQWIELQMLVVSSSSRGAGMYVRLVIKQWDQGLMNYALALQNELLADIARFEPQASVWLHGISWQLEMADGCPYTVVPDKEFWLKPAKQAAPVVPAAKEPPVAHALETTPTTEANDALEDLNRLFFIRDQDMSKSAGELAPVGYENTQPSRL